MVVMVWHVVEEICKNEAVQILGVKKYDTMFWCMVWCYARRSQAFLRMACGEDAGVSLHTPPKMLMYRDNFPLCNFLTPPTTQGSSRSE